MSQEIEEFYAGKAGDYYSCLGQSATSGIYRLFSWPDEYHPLDDFTDMRWQFLMPGSDGWELAHRLIYREARTRRIDASQLPVAIPPGSFLEVTGEFLPREILATTQFPRVAQWLRLYPAYAANLTLVLEVDLYESRFGDGRFLYLHRVLLPHEEPERMTDEPESSPIVGSAYHCIHFGVQQVYEEFRFPQWSLGRDEHYTPQGVLKMLEGRL